MIDDHKLLLCESVRKFACLTLFMRQIFFFVQLKCSAPTSMFQAYAASKDTRRSGEIDLGVQAIIEAAKPYVNPQ